jgi:hypothetical protein
VRGSGDHLKYFTREWRERGDDGDVAPFEAYARYLDSVRAALPPQLLRLHDDYTLHDAEVHFIRSDFGERTVLMAFDGWDAPLQNPLRYELRFTEVLAFEQVLPPQAHVESRLGDLAYWECELLPAAVEVRMLFSSHAKFRIVFKGFAFEPAHRAS